MFGDEAIPSYTIDSVYKLNLFIGRLLRPLGV